MDKYRIIILGSQCSGKSTLIEYLKSNYGLNCIDHDQEIIKRSQGIYPKDQQYVKNDLLPEIELDIINKNRIIYTANFFGVDQNNCVDIGRFENAKKMIFLLASSK